MSIINLEDGNITLNAYLRADSFSQIYKVKKGEEFTSIVSDRDFWGETPESKKLYLDYSSIDKRQLACCTGMSVDAQIVFYENEECDRWINDNLINGKMTNLFVVQGYAGCGKTTFINFIKRKAKCTNFEYTDVADVGTPFNECSIFFTKTLDTFMTLYKSVFSDRKKRKILEKFKDLLREDDSIILDPELKDVVNLFNKRYRGKKTFDEIRDVLNNRYAGEHLQNDNVWHTRGNIILLTSLTLLLKYAICFACKNITNSDIAFIFDNLDAITDPCLSSEAVYFLWLTMCRIREYKDRKKDPCLPDIKIYIMIRKILHSHIVSYLPDLEMYTNLDPSALINCDISRLYLSRSIVEHRVKFWEDTVDKNDYEAKNKLQKLGNLLAIQDDRMPMEEIEQTEATSSNNDSDDTTWERINITKDHLNLDALFNHNYRAFANVLDILIEMDISSAIQSTSQLWQKVSLVIFTLSLLYRKHVWKDLGFGCKNCSMQDYPTTLNRLILNMLYVARAEKDLYRLYDRQTNNIFRNNYISLNDLVGQLEKITFMRIECSDNEVQISDKRKKVSVEDSKELILHRLAEMCARNTNASNTHSHGFDPNEDEIWRRPMYFIGGVKTHHTAATADSLYTYFRDRLYSEDGDRIQFAITDEGMILIQDIFAHFEFYSGRYCSTVRKALHQVTSVDEINQIISPVYNAIKKCCERTIAFLNEYQEKYSISLDDVLKKGFHPRTNPRRTKNPNNGRITFVERTFRPQIHVVRVIFSHISYFTKTRDSISNGSYDDKEVMINAFNSWIESYLDLYKNYFLDYLKNSEHIADNTVYNALLKKLLSDKQNKSTSK